MSVGFNLSTFFLFHNIDFTNLYTNILYTNKILYTKKMKIFDIEKFFDNSKNKTIAVVGDVMLDQYFWGDVSRVSPEAPVPVVDIISESYHLGGAANVAQNLLSLGITPFLCGLLGNDNRGNRFIEICDKMNISSDGLYRDDTRITTVKTRVIGNNQQIVRMDREVRKTINEKGENYIYEQIKNIKTLDGIIFEDYDKGTITKTLISKIIPWAKNNNIPVFVDPKFNNFKNYSGATLFKPNKKETEAGLEVKLNTTEQIRLAGRRLIEELGLENVLITLGADGMMLFEHNGNISSVSTVARKVSDVSGAGDTAIASLAAMFVAGAKLHQAAIIANFAAGAVCEKPGIVAITKEEIIEVAKRYLK